MLVSWHVQSRFFNYGPLNEIVTKFWPLAWKFVDPWSNQFTVNIAMYWSWYWCKQSSTTVYCVCYWSPNFSSIFIVFALCWLWIAHRLFGQVIRPVCLLWGEKCMYLIYVISIHQFVMPYKKKHTILKPVDTSSLLSHVCIITWLLWLWKQNTQLHWLDWNLPPITVYLTLLVLAKDGLFSWLASCLPAIRTGVNGFVYCF